MHTGIYWYYKLIVEQKINDGKPTFPLLAPCFQAATPSPSGVPVKIFITALYKVKAFLHICLKKRQVPALFSTSKLITNFEVTN